MIHAAYRGAHAKISAHPDDEQGPYIARIVEPDDDGNWGSEWDCPAAIYCRTEAEAIGEAVTAWIQHINAEFDR